MTRSLLALSLFLMCSFPTFGQEGYRLKKLKGPITFDGKVDDIAWKDIDYLPMVQYEPVFMGEMNEETRIRISYDDKYVYLSGEMYVKNPDDITTNSLYRDRYSSDDLFAIIIDGFNDDQNATWFFINPDGVRFDMQISNDADFSGGRSAMNSSYNTYWDAITTKTDKGWFAEIRIPFSSIGVQVENDIAEIGFISYRWLTAINERHIFPAIPPNWRMGNAKPSQAFDVKLEGIKGDKPIYLTPFVLGGATRFSELNTSETAYEYVDDPQAEIGLDLKLNPTTNSTLDVTLNTDFAQVEADEQQLNLSRFSVFFPEKRQFFQQRSALFDFSYNRDRVFYSRKIGLDDGGNPVRILGGARLTGRFGKWDVGLINMQTGKNNSVSTENFGIFRLKREFLNSRSYLGGIITSRRNADGDINMVYGVDTDINITGENFFELKTSEVIDNRVTNVSGWDASALRFAVRRSASTGFSYQLTYNRIGEDHLPDIGFIRIGGITENSVNLGYGVLAKEASIFKSHSMNTTFFSRNYNDQYEFLNYSKGLQSQTIRSSLRSEFKQLGNINFTLRMNKELINPGDEFDLVRQIFIPVGEYNTKEFSVNYSFAESWRLAGNVEFKVGDIYDGKISSMTLNPKFFVSKKIEIGGRYQLTHLEFDPTPGRQKRDYTTHLGQLKSQYAFNKKASINLFVQYSNISELIGANMRFRYNFSEGRDFWLVLNEQGHMNRNPLEVGLPRLPYLQTRSILLKYTHTLFY